MKCNIVREHAENILNGNLDEDTLKAMWLMLVSFDRYRMLPAELKQLLISLKSQLIPDNKL